MNILLLSSSFNGLCQRVYLELQQLGHAVSVELSPDPETIERAALKFSPDLILCPFLKHRVPEDIWKNYTCLVVHPGVEGDRGSSSLDWAIHQQQKEWGVTVLQAAEKMDSGDIWATKTFPMREAAKASIYRREVTETAIELLYTVLQNYQDKEFKPRTLDYSRQAVKGKWQNQMQQQERCINWLSDTTDTVITKINTADSFPGVLDEIWGNSVFLYGASRETQHTGNPGQLIGYNNGAICRATVDGAVWIKQLKNMPGNNGNTAPTYIKLPAMQVIETQFNNAEELSKLAYLPSNDFCEISSYVEDQVCYLSFDFYNGAMTTEQCIELQKQIIEIKSRDDIKVLVLQGGEEAWSNGINLNTIEAADDPALESWNNINAINDLVLEILTMTDKLTVAALRSGAGAGGVMLALACDRVVVRDGIVLNPHYRTMGLYGSEYWTYSLPRRVGAKKAKQITEGCMPMLANEALKINLADEILSKDWKLYHEQLNDYCGSLADSAGFDIMVERKSLDREQDEKRKPLSQYRSEELNIMKNNFFDDSFGYCSARQSFVYKKPLDKTPDRLVANNVSFLRKVMGAR